MPFLTRLFIKTSLVYFAAALLVGVLLALQSAGALSNAFAGLAPVYFHLFMVGWITQLIIGIAFWMFPKFSREKPRGSESLAWATYILLNAGLALRGISEPLLSPDQPLWGWLLVVASTLMWLGGGAFVLNTWTRVKEK
jgi:hypothetical protein